MKCTKCGKEIPDGEDKICEDCQKELLNSIESVESEVNKGSDKKEKASKEDKKEAIKKDDKQPVKEKKDTKQIKCVIVGIIAIICIIAIIIGFVNLISSKMSNKVGNTIGNIRNYGYATDDGKWIYFISPDDSSNNVGIFKVKKDGTKKQQLYMNENSSEIVSLNVRENYVYFLEINSQSDLDNDEVDNKIYRMKKNGSKLEVINDNEINNDCYEFYVIDNFVYYIDVNSNIAKMNLDGSNKEVLVENTTGYLGVTENYIIYNVENEAKDNYITYIMNIDGTDAKPIIENTRLYSVNIEGDYIYYTDVNKKICKTKIGSGVAENVLDVEAYNLNVKDGFAYYLNYRDTEKEDYTVCIYKVNLKSDKIEAEEIKDLYTYSSFLNIVNNWALYMDSNEANGFIYIVKLDGSKEVVELYNIDYNKYLEEENAQVEESAEAVEETPEAPSEDTTNVDSQPQAQETEKNENTQSEAPVTENTANTVNTEATNTVDVNDSVVENTVATPENNV